MTDLEIELLACPCCKGAITPLGDDANPEGLACPACQLVYPVDGGIPVMLKEEAVPAVEWESGARRRKS